MQKSEKFYEKLKKVATTAFAPTRNLTKVRKIFILKITNLHVKLPSLPLFRGKHFLTQRMCSSRHDPYPDPFAYLRSIAEKFHRCFHIFLKISFYFMVTSLNSLQVPLVCMVNIQWTYGEHIVNILWRCSEDVVKIWWRYSEDIVKI